MAIATWAGYPAHYGRGRERAPQYIVIHYTAGAEGRTAAEDGAAYDKRRADSVSTHCFADANSVVREVPDGDTAYAAFPHGNAIGLHLEICGTIQTRAQWLDETSMATLRMAAAQVAEWCAQYGFPARRLSVAEVRAAYYAPEGQRPSGICGHVDVTHAYPEDGGDHTDPGPEFPWDVFIDLVAQALGGQSSTVEEAMITDAEQCRIALLTVYGATDEGYKAMDAVDPVAAKALRDHNISAVEERLTAKIDALAAKVGQPAPVDAAAVAKALLADPAFAKALADAAFAGAQRAEKE